MKKVLALVLSVLMVLSLAACGGDKAEETKAPESKKEETQAPAETKAEESKAEESKAEETKAPEGGTTAAGEKIKGEGKKIGVLIRTFSDTYTSTVRTFMEQYLEEAGCEYEIVDANDSQATQNEQLESFLSKGVDGIICQTVNVSASADILSKCKDADVPILFFNHQPDDLSIIAAEPTTIFIGTDSPEAGYMQADLFMQFWDEEKYDRNKDGVVQCVVFQGSPESQEAFDRSQFCIEGAEDEGYKFEKLEDNYLCNWDSTLAQEAMTAFLGTHEDEIEVVFCNNDSMAEGVVAALNAVGYNTGVEGDPEVLVFGVDATDAGVALIDAGKMQGTVKQDGDAMALTNVQIMLRLCNDMTKEEAAADYGMEIFEGDKASIRIPYAAYTK